MQQIKKITSIGFHYLFLFFVAFIIFACEKNTDPIQPLETQWTVDSTLVEEIINKVDSIRIRNSIQTLQNFGTRFTFSSKCDQASQWIKSKLTSYGLDVSEQSFEHYKLNKISFVDELNGWVVGKYGFILRTNDGGKFWQKQDSKTLNNLKDVFFVNVLNGWAGGDDILLHTTDSGESWHIMDNQMVGSINDIFFLNESMGWLATENALFKTIDEGENWESIYSSECSSIYFLSDSVGFLGSPSRILKTTDMGLTWQPIKSGISEIKEIDFDNTKHGITISGNSIYFTKDSGESWMEQTITAHHAGLVGCQIVDSITYVAHCMDYLFTSYDGGVSWSSKTLDTDINSLYFRNKKDGILSGIFEFKVSNDAGRSWQNLSTKSIDDILLFHNIKATKIGKIHPEIRIVIGAHYDAIAPNAINEAPGANDNASGSAAVLEIARVMSEYNFDLTIDYIFFDHEEIDPVRLGSKIAAEKSSVANEQIVEMINLDMIGYCPDDIHDIQIHSPNTEHRGGFISRALRYSDIIVYEANNYLSDEKSYYQVGYPSLLISEYTFATVRDYPWYHSTEDKIDKLNIGFTNEVAKFVLRGVCLQALPVYSK